MKHINIEKSWNNIITEVHDTKPNSNNLIERELLLILQVFLSKYELAKAEKNEKLMKFCVDVLNTYEKHNINGHIVWEK